MAKGSPSQTPTVFHPTATKLIEATIELLETMPIEKVSLAAVLERTGISHGPLYHHFTDFSDLVEHAVAQRYARSLAVQIDAFRPLLDSLDRDDFQKSAEATFRQSLDPARKKNRMERVEIMGALHSHPRLVDLVSRVQKNITNEIGEIIHEAQSRGWFRSDLDPVAVAGFLQAMIIGRIIDDVTEDRIDPEEWKKVALEAFRAIVTPR